MENVKLNVDWLKERTDNTDDNKGFHFGVYTFDCLESDFDKEAGYGSYDVIDVKWYNTEKERFNQ